MIFVTLGTQDKPFVRLLKALDKALVKGSIKDRVVVQAGTTKYESTNMEIFDFLDIKAFEDCIKECDLLITHGGVGSIFTGLKKGKKVIAVSRLSKYGEHVNDHQLEIVRKFVDDGYILELRDFNKISKILDKASKMRFKKMKNVSNKRMVNLIEDFIDKI